MRYRKRQIQEAACSHIEAADNNKNVDQFMRLTILGSGGKTNHINISPLEALLIAGILDAEDKYKIWPGE